MTAHLRQSRSANNLAMPFECVALGYAAPLRHAAQNLAVKLGLDTHSVRLAQDGIDAWRLCFRICPAAEAWAAHGRWVTETSPQFGEDISRRFAMAAGLDAALISLVAEMETITPATSIY